MVYVFERSKLAAPSTIIQLPRCMFGNVTYATLSGIDGHFLKPYFEGVIRADRIAAILKRFDKTVDCNCTWCFLRPIVLAEMVRPPFSSGISGSPRNAVVVVAVLAGFRPTVWLEIRKVFLPRFAHHRRLLSFPQVSQALVIACSFPWSSSATGFAPVRIASAQNQSPGSFSSSRRMRGTTSGPSAMIAR